MVVYRRKSKKSSTERGIKKFIVWSVTASSLKYSIKYGKINYRLIKKVYAVRNFQNKSKDCTKKVYNILRAVEDGYYVYLLYLEKEV